MYSRLGLSLPNTYTHTSTRTQAGRCVLDAGRNEEHRGGEGLHTITTSSHCIGSPAHFGKAAANKHEAVQGDSITWQHAGRGALLIAPHTVAYFWDKLGRFVPVHPQSATHLQSDLSFILQPGLFTGSPACWCPGKWTSFGIYTLQGPLHTNKVEQQTLTSCWLYPLPFLQLWYVLCPFAPRWSLQN